MPQGNSFITNSTGTAAVRKEDVMSLKIVEKKDSFELYLQMGTNRASEIVFETDATDDGIKAKAATVLAALES